MKPVYKLLLLFLTLVKPCFVWSQFTYLPINTFTNYHIDRMDISGQMKNVITSVKPLSRLEFNKINYYSNNSSLYKFTERYYQTELFEFPLIEPQKDTFDMILLGQSPWFNFKNRIYATPAAFFSAKMDGLTLMINPTLGIGGGIDLEAGNYTQQLSAGVEIRGMIDNKVGFYTHLTKNQFRFPQYYTDIIDSGKVIPGEGYHTRSGNRDDFVQSRGYFTFSPTKHIGLQFGQDGNFIGNGYRSLILSNYSKDYLFMKVNTKIWRFNYQNLFTQLTDYNRQSATGKGIKPKYFVNHYLGIKLFENLDLGVFESVIYDRSDSIKNGYFDFNYLNPIIFYTSVERNLNSGDNAIIGMDWKWNIKRRYSFYGQLVLDEFSKDSLLQRTGWWANKFGIQTGLKYINAFTVKGLDLQAEYNLVRPYTYSHFKRSQNYVNYNAPLAHPYGANFKEMVLLVKYQPRYKLFIEAGFINALKGLDSSLKTKHFGGNILETYFKRPYESGHTIGQGVKTTYQILWLNVSAMIYHNLWVDARANLRTVKSELSKFESNSFWFQVGLRLNLGIRAYDF